MTTASKPLIKQLVLGCLAVISLLLLFFVVKNYRDARPIADEILFGLAHSLHAAIEYRVVNDPSLRSLASFHSDDIAYFALVDTDGVYRYHTDPKLLGSRLLDEPVLRRLDAETMSGSRVRLATGEEGYELFSHVHTHDNVSLGLRLVLHAQRADFVIHNALVNMLIMVSLLIMSWVLIGVIFRYILMEEKHKRELALRDNLARMGEMGAMLAHEIRNPLAGIKGFAQLIEKKTGEDHSRDSAHRILTETVRLEELTTDLLAFARNDRFTRKTVDIVALVEHTADLIHNEAESAQVVVDVFNPVPLFVIGDPDGLTQVLLNIVRNGLQAISAGGSITIATRKAGPQVEIEISDTGHGISSKDMARVFDPFFTTKARGTGLGLALCRKIVAEHDGEIRIDSSPAGTRVTIFLPWSRGEKST